MGATVRFAGGESVRAAYVVGADGMHSTVREQAGIAFTGEAYAESFSLADVRLSGGVPDDEVVLYFSPAGVLVVAPLPGGSYRIVATVAEAPKVPDVAFVQRLLDSRGRRRAGRSSAGGGVGFAVPGPPPGRRRLPGRADPARRRRRARPQPGGRAGHERRHHRRRSPSRRRWTPSSAAALPTCSTATARSARPVARQIVSLADRITRLATVDRRLRPVRNLALRLLATLPAFRRQLAWRLSGLVYTLSRLLQEAAAAPRWPA